MFNTGFPALITFCIFCWISQSVSCLHHDEWSCARR